MWGLSSYTLWVVSVVKKILQKTITDNWADVMWKICISSSVCAPLSLPVLSLRPCLHSVRYHKGCSQQTCQHSGLCLSPLARAQLRSHFRVGLLLPGGESWLRGWGSRQARCNSSAPGLLNQPPTWEMSISGITFFLCQARVQSEGFSPVSGVRVVTSLLIVGDICYSA